MWSGNMSDQGNASKVERECGDASVRMYPCCRN